MVAGVGKDALTRLSDSHFWAVDQLARLERGDPVDRLGLATMLRTHIGFSRTESRACVRAVVKAQLLGTHGPLGCQTGQRASELQHRQRLHSMMGSSLALELSTEWPRLYHAGATQAAEELRDLGGDPILLPQHPPCTWTEFMHRGHQDLLS